MNNITATPEYFNAVLSERYTEANNTRLAAEAKKRKSSGLFRRIRMRAFSSPRWA